MFGLELLVGSMSMSSFVILYIMERQDLLCSRVGQEREEVVDVLTGNWVLYRAATLEVWAEQCLIGIALDRFEF